MIPEVAVGAAISAMLRTTPNLYRLSADVLARVALEAAAPHMLAQFVMEAEQQRMIADYERPAK